MKKLLYLSAFLFITVFLSAQDCPDGSVTFTTQEEVDMFLQTYPDCKELNGSLTIGTSIDNLDALLGITSIAGGITLKENLNLSSFSGLDSLVSIGIGPNISVMIQQQNPFMDKSLSFNENSLFIYKNSSLLNFDGLNGLDSLSGKLYIEDNSLLENLDGLAGLTWVGSGSASYYDNENQDLSTITNSSIYIYGNQNLESISGLDNIINVSGSIRITSNNVLEGSVLTNLKTIGEEHEMGSLFGQEYEIFRSLHITANPNLSYCINPGICTILSNEENTQVNGNGPFCSASVILDMCSDFSSVLHPLFYDSNENGIHDVGEPFLNGGKIDVLPGNFSSYTNDNTGGLVYLNQGISSLSLDTSILQNWNLTSDSVTFHVTVDSINFIDSIYFGIIPKVYLSEIQTLVSSSALRCNEIVIFDVIANNSGTTIADGTIWFEADSNITNVSYLDVPDIFIEPNLYGWNFADFYPSTTIKKQIRFQIPGPDDFTIGNPIISNSQVIFNDLNGIDSIHYSYSQILECAYDPNDKLVGPVYPENYALIGDPLFYTIRFQNTGNAEAYDVLIQDEIDLNLDINSLQLIGSSHLEVLSISVDEDRLIKFEFRDIFLPDSTTNFEESQGYVSFMIQANNDIAEFTSVENYAEIIFDYNPAIITNTTLNIMVSSFDADFDGSLIWDDCDDTNADVNPDAEEVVYDGFDNDCNPETLDDDLDQDGFLLADDCDDTEENVNPQADEVPYDGLDNDCDSETLDDDLDQDGFILADDCDDTNPDVNPDAEEIPDNGIDEDCDGDDLTGIQEIDVATIQFYPNPVKQTLILKQVGTSISEYEVRMYNTTGKVIYKAEFSNKQKSLNLVDVDPGFYFLNFVDMNSGQRFSRKILVEGM